MSKLTVTFARRTEVTRPESCANILETALIQELALGRNVFLSEDRCDWAVFLPLESMWLSVRMLGGSPADTLSTVGVKQTRAKPS